MTLKTGNEQLRRIDRRIDLLIEDIRTEMLARDNASNVTKKSEIENIVAQKLKYIANPLKNFKINGEVDVLDDIVMLYNKAIQSLEKIIDEKRYSDDKKVSNFELNAFKQAKDFLSKDFQQGAEVINNIYTAIKDEYNKGKLIAGYKISRNMDKYKVNRLNEKIANIDRTYNVLFEPVKKIASDLRPEMGLVKKELANYKEIEKLSNNYKTANSKNKQLILDRKINLIKEKFPVVYEAHKNDGKTKEEQAEILEKYTLQAKERFVLKIKNSFDKNIFSAKNVYGRYFLEKTTFGNKYFNGKNYKDEITLEELENFFDNFQIDVYNLQKRINELKFEKKMCQIQKESLAMEKTKKTEYMKPMSKFEKWKERVVFRFKNLDKFFASKEEVELAILNQKREKEGFDFNGKKIIMDIEEQQRMFRKELEIQPNKVKTEIKEKLKKDIFKKWDKNKAR